MKIKILQSTRRRRPQLERVFREYHPQYLIVDMIRTKTSFTFCLSVLIFTMIRYFVRHFVLRLTLAKDAILTLPYYF